MRSLKSLFAPQSIAVIGASRREGTLGKMFLDAIVKMNYKGKIYPVNPKAEKINKIQCYPDIESVPETPDLAIILLPKEMVLTAVEQIAKKKIKNIVVISAGFKEVGADGMQREGELIELIRKHEIRMIGPNSMGLFNMDKQLSLNATFSPTTPLKGHVSFISQSGALGVAVLELSQKLGLGFSCFVSTGNKADIGDVDCLNFLKEDDNTKVIILYQEGIDNPIAFRNICMKIVPSKPVLALKAGRTKSGFKAASSHTGALASDDKITDAFLIQCGVLRCQTLQEILEAALVLNSQPLPEGKKVGVITNAGGPGILVSDALEIHGLELADLSDTTHRSLVKMLPPEAGLNNPVDMIASATHETYHDVAYLLEKDPGVDAILVIIVKPPVNTTPQMIITELKSLIDQSKKPFIFTIMAQENSESGHHFFRENNIPVFSYPESTARALGNMVRYSEIKKKFIKSKPINIDVKASSTGNISHLSAKNVLSMLKKYQLNVCDYKIVKSIDQATKYFESTGTIALKIANEEVVHKSDEGLVKLNLSSKGEVEEAFNHILLKSKSCLSQNVSPILLAQKMIPEGVELVLGAKRDPLFGPVIMFGIGGVFVELYKDVVFRVAPLDEISIEDMINELQGEKLLLGFRNFPIVDQKLLVKTIVNFSEMVINQPEIVEIDLNPIIWSREEKDFIVVDSRCTVCRAHSTL